MEDLHRASKEAFAALSLLPEEEALEKLDATALSEDVRARVRTLLQFHYRVTSTQISLSDATDQRRVVELDAGVVVGRYRIVREIGRGGMGVVYEARDETLRRDVAIKIAAVDPASGPGKLGLKEAQALAVTQHPRIAPVYDVLDVGDCVAFAMPLLLGGTLAERISGLGDADVDARKDLVRQLSAVCSGLDEVHQSGILHLDLKPQNILFDASDRAVVVDFGASAVDGVQDSRAATRGYAAPEQVSGGSLSPATDVYAIGVILRQLCVGVRAEAGDPVVRFDRTLNRDLTVIIRRCTERDPADRYASAAAVALELREAIAGRPILARPPSVYRHAGRWLRAKRGLSTVAGVVLVLFTAGIIALDRSSAKVIVDVVDGPPGDVYLVDPEGELEHVGRTPLTHRATPSVTARFLIEREGEIAEFWTRPERWKTRRHDVRPVAATDVLDGMTALAGAVLPTLIDQREVSNEEYLEFVVETGAERPALWPEGELPQSWRHLPVTMISSEDGARYAAWRGKRMATVAELNRVWESAGRIGRDLPIRNPPFRYDVTDELRGEYFRELDALYKDALPDGEVGFLHDGVAELVIEDSADARALQDLNDVMVGNPWYRWAGPQEATLPKRLIPPNRRYIEVGFRCAKTVGLHAGIE